MSWLFSQALVEEFLGDTSSDGEQSALSSGKPTQQAYCAPDKMTAFSRLSQFGMMYKPLTESRGEELLMSYLAGFHAKTSQSQGGGQELTERDQECGEKWHASFTKYSLVTHSWKTHQCSLLGDLDEFLETWPQWGLMRDGQCWEQRMLEQNIRGTESGSLLPTPDTVNRDNKKVLFNKNATSQSGRSLATYARTFPTPQASDNRDRGNMSNPSIQRRVAIGKQIMLSQSVDPTSGQLNPMWVEWLMGWPLGWTDLKPLAMDKSHCAQPQHGES
jgi:hypothetical protein